MSRHLHRLIFFCFILFLFSCETKKNKKKQTAFWYLSNTEPMKKAWLKTDTAYFRNYVVELEKETDKNMFYSHLSDFYELSGRVIIAFDDSCQGEKHLIFNDLLIDSSKEVMNKKNVINGLKTYMESRLLFHCNLDSDILESILDSSWKKCALMNKTDFEILLAHYNNYADILPKCDTCYLYILDSTITYHRSYLPASADSKD